MALPKSSRALNMVDLCSKSRENARRVYEDAGRDLNGIFDAYIKWGAATAQAKEWIDPIAAAKHDLSQRALASDKIQSLHGPYKEVRDAASECGFGEHFSLSYKVLSKFAHPTAMRILSLPKNGKH